MKPVSMSFETGFIALRKYLRWPTKLLASTYGYMVNEKRGTLRMPRHQFCNWLSHYKLTVLPSDHDRYTVFCVSIYSWKSTS